MFKKLLHRITVVWCLYGLVRVCIIANPLAFRLIKIFKPLWDDNSRWSHLEDEPWNMADPFHIVCVWFWVAVGIVVIMAISAGIHHFANWFFNTANENEEA